MILPCIYLLILPLSLLHFPILGHFVQMKQKRVEDKRYSRSNKTLSFLMRMIVLFGSYLYTEIPISKS